MSTALAGFLGRRWGLLPEAEVLIQALEQAWTEGHSGLELSPAALALLTDCPAVAQSLDDEARPLVLCGETLQSWRHARAERETAQRLKTLTSRVLPPAGAGLLRDWTRVYPDAQD
ncbi:MAG: hypothetical protein ACREKE_03395, partial [bacterium]